MRIPAAPRNQDGRSVRAVQLRARLIGGRQRRLPRVSKRTRQSFNNSRISLMVMKSISSIAIDDNLSYQIARPE